MPEPPASPAPVELHSPSSGAGPALLFLHGLGGDHTVWNGLREQLGNDVRALTPDLRGHGRSPLPDGSKLSFAEHEADLVALLDREGIGRAHLIGLSAGAMVALRLAFDHPERVERLVLVGGCAHLDAHSRAVWESWAETLRSEGFDAYVLRLLKDLFYPDWIEAHLEYADALRESLRGRDLQGAAQWARAMGGFDLRGRLSRLRSPTLVVHGMDDRVVDPSHARLLRQAIPGAELKLYARTGHLVPVERAAELAPLLREWVARPRPDPPSASPG